MTHFTDIELHRWRDAGPGTDRERVIAHIAECAECAARYAAAIRNRPLQAQPANDGADFVALARRRAPKWVAPLAAAAVIAIAVMVPLTMRHREPALQLRGGGIQTFSSETELAWASGVAAARYRVEISGGYQLVTDKTRITIPKLAPGTYTWTVTALDAQGKPLAVSPPRTLTIQR
jgi:hypothetical protein